MKTAAKILGTDYHFRKGAYIQNLHNFYTFYNEICAALQTDVEMKELLASTLTDDCYEDACLRTLTIDIGFYISRIYNHKETEPTPEESENQYPVDTDAARPIHYWLYTPGYGAVMWEQFYEDGLMGIAREFIGDLRQYASRKEIQEKMRECTAGDSYRDSYSIIALEAWHFVHELKLGDVIFAKGGKHAIMIPSMSSGCAGFTKSLSWNTTADTIH